MSIIPTIPAAAPTFLRDPEGPLKYRVVTRIGDWFAGLRDAKSPVVSIEPELMTAWLATLHAEYLTRTEGEHRAMATAIAVLDDMIASHRAAIATASAEREALQTVPVPGVSDSPTTAADERDAEAIRLARSQRRSDQTQAAQRTRDEQLRAAIAAAEAQIGVLETAKGSHRTVTAIRAAHLAHHYGRRQATYVRRLTRKWDRAALPPALPAPSWSTTSVTH